MMPFFTGIFHHVPIIGHLHKLVKHSILGQIEPGFELRVAIDLALKTTKFGRQQGRFSWFADVLLCLLKWRKSGRKPSFDRSTAIYLYWSRWPVIGTCPKSASFWSQLLSAY